MNLEFVQASERKMPKGKRIKAVRANSAAYQADVFNYCEETHKIFAIGADQDAVVGRDRGHSGRLATDQDGAYLLKAVTDEQGYERALHDTRRPGAEIAESYLAHIKAKIAQNQGALLMASSHTRL
jgi:hypothetical protein